MTFPLRKRVIGAHFKAARQYYVSNRFWLEIYLGIGLNFRKYTIANNPRMTYQVNDLFTPIATNRTEAVPALPAGFRILYRLDKLMVTHPKR